MDSMMRNLKRHKAEETELGFNWEQWQALQLKELERYRAQNLDKFSKEFGQINRKIEAMYRTTAADAQAQQEAFILDQIRKKDFRPGQNKDISFFGLNDDKLDILIARTQNDFTRAEYAVLRRADDIYRRTIFDAQVYANITNDYNKAVDMATHDFLKAGLQSVEYKNGARHNIAEYARMAIRTGNKRAYLMGQGNAHDKYGIHTVRVNRRTQACPLCVGYLGRVLVDDVYGGGTAREAAQLGVPTLSSAMQAGFLHPNCKDIYSLYIEGISQPAKPWTKPEIEQIVGEYNTEQSLRHAADMAESYTRLAKYALDPGNAQKYQARADQWRSRETDLATGYERYLASEGPGFAGSAPGIQAKNFQAFADSAFNDRGLELLDEIRELDLDLVEQSMETMRPLLDEITAIMPDALEQVPIQLARGTKALMSAVPSVISPDGRTSLFTIKYNNDYNDRKIIAERIAAAVKNKTLLPGTTPESVGTHELGHYINWLLCQNSADPLDDWDNTKTAIDICQTVFARLGGTKDVLDVSLYALKKGPDEMLAEAFHDVYGIRKEQASDFNKELVRETLERLKKSAGR
jgi:hypothetical protein